MRSYADRPSKPKTHKKRKKLEFMQRALVTVIVFSVIFTAASYVLSIFDKNPLEELSSTIITTLWRTSGVGLGTYAFQNAVRAVTGSFGGYIPKESEDDENADSG